MKLLEEFVGKELLEGIKKKPKVKVEKDKPAPKNADDPHVFVHTKTVSRGDTDHLKSKVPISKIHAVIKASLENDDDAMDKLMGSSDRHYDHLSAIAAGLYDPDDEDAKKFLKSFKKTRAGGLASEERSVGIGKTKEEATAHMHAADAGLEGEGGWDDE